MRKYIRKGKQTSNYRHGGRYTRLYEIWLGMKKRCYNRNHRAFKHYGARGIKVCKAWHSFPAFRNWSKANGYRNNLTIDRIYSDKGYYPSNCRWATYREQAQYRRLYLYQKKTSRFIGVSRHKYDWVATVKYNQKRIYLGASTNEFSAAWIRDAYIKRHKKYERYTLNNLKDRRKQKTKVLVERRQSCARA
jgi:hypothetical protein